MKSALVVLIALGALVLVAYVLVLVRRKESAGDRPWPFFVRKPMSAPEQVLYFRLLAALPEHIVLAQVQLSRFLGVKRGNSVQAWLNRVNRLSVDFLILKKDASVVAAIELDDSTHSRKDRREADARKNRALSDAGVRLLRWPVAKIPTADEIREQLARRPALPPEPADRAGRIEPVLARPA